MSFMIKAQHNDFEARDWKKHLSTEGRNRTGAVLKNIAATLDSSATISLGIGRPVPQLYPWRSIAIDVVDVNSSDPRLLRSELSLSCGKTRGGFDLGTVLNYCGAPGFPDLVDFVSDHVQSVHKPPYLDSKTCLTCSTTSALDIIFRMLCDRGDCILTEAHTYSGATNAARNLGLRVFGVTMDEHGLIADDLRAKLEKWDIADGPKPSLLYLIPCGQNPTGATLSLQRRKAIYQIAEEHDLIVIEDDPYYYLHLGPGKDPKVHQDVTTSSSDDFVTSLPHSFLSLDVSGRVLRLDSTSKILAPGLRLGWLTGCTQLVNIFLGYTELSTVSPSGPSQMMLYELFNDTWGHVGLLRWLSLLSLQYQKRRNLLVGACERHLSQEICRWLTPSAGMFLWVEVLCHKHPANCNTAQSQSGKISCLDIEDRIYLRSRTNGVLVSKGSWFAVDKDRSSRIFFRLTFAAAQEEAFEQAVERFGAAIDSEFALN